MRRVEQTFEGVAGSVSQARHLVSEALEAEGARDDLWTAVQIVSELATNAVVHAATAFTVIVTVDNGLMRIAVTDEKPFVRATERHFSDYTTTGRGLRLVERLSRSWGVETSVATKTVWCEIVRVTSGGEPAPSATSALPGVRRVDGGAVSASAASLDDDGTACVRAQRLAA